MIWQGVNTINQKKPGVLTINPISFHCLFSNGYFALKIFWNI